MSPMEGGERPQNVGILAADIYFPSTFVTQEDLEKANGVSAGKYTIRLGQEAMGFTGDREDINSVSLTVVAQLLEKYDIPKTRIGRIEVGTQTLIDKSKSTKTVLMSLFEGSGNEDIEGVTTVNACYGGTAALLNAVAWVESSGWDGRYAIVVAADIAVYAKGPSRPVGGCAAVAVLVGPDAPLVVDMRTRVSYACDVWDFFKPDMSSEYPRVYGQLAQTWYLRALDSCYDRMAKKKKMATAAPISSDACQGRGEEVGSGNGENVGGGGGAPFVMSDVDHVLFHSPFNLMVRQSFARMVFADAKRLKAAGKPLGEGKEEALGRWFDVPVEATYSDRDLEKALEPSAGVSSDAYRSLVEPGCRLSKQIGNSYTASVFANIICLVCAQGAALEGQTALVFSYGSGGVATMYELHFRDTAAATPAAASTSTATSAPRFSVARIAEAVDLAARLADRERLPPAEFEAALAARFDAHSVAAGDKTDREDVEEGAEGAEGGEGGGHSMSTPEFPVDRLFPGAFYLDGIAGDRSRSYSRRPKDAIRARGGPLAPSLARKAAAAVASTAEEAVEGGKEGDGSGGRGEAAT